MAIRPALLAALLAVALAGCSSGGRSPVLGAVMDRFLPSDEEETAAAGSAPAPQLTREAIRAAGTPMVRGRLVDENARSVLSAVAQNGSYTTYISRFGQTLTIRGGSLITASRGLGYDLLSVATSPADPAVRPRPVAQWPASITRTYRFPAEGPDGDARTVTCRFVPGEPREIEIVEITYSGTQVEEICEGDGLSFTNYHFAESETGFIRRSLQWLGPDQGLIDLEILAAAAVPG
ncbi:hypothetical protein HMH01_03010 [Halovulum dunhuangense]|uniref:Group 4 capsule polysaccharide lipoprotein GfcB/YjbF n=1 Tax=Halovulum dunhuangense TaxID=1505036 RepID=A0A849KRA8_9RHOB|nr:YjbF family lipoprotein [Halovulum dunhuangense]NNU79399.1 hypothetical protein [Halovulum dunhuangense]